MLFSVAMVLVISGILFLAYSHMKVAIEKEQVVDQVNRGIFELNIAADDYLLTERTRAMNQWRQRYASLERLILSGKFVTPEEKGLKRGLKENLERLHFIFSRLSKNGHSGVSVSGDLKERLMGHLLISSHSMLSTGRELSEICDRELLSLQRKTAFLILLSIFIIGVVIAVNSILMGRRIVSPIGKLREDVRAVGEGNLDYPLGTKADDEIGDLSRAFDRMAKKLKTVMTSRDNLEKEISERKRVEKDLRNSNATLELAQKMAGLGYWSYDVETQMSTWSEEMYVVLGVNPKQGPPSYEDHKKIWHKDDWNMFDQAVQDAIHLGKSHDIVVRIIFPDDSIHYVHTQGFPRHDENGKITELYGTSQDITERMRKEEALKESEERYAKIIENVLVGVYQATLDGKLLFANKKIMEMFGYSSFKEFEAVGSIAELYARPEEGIGVVNEIIKEGSTNAEVEFRRKDGQSIWVRLHTRKATNREGTIILEGLMEDVTEIRRVTAQLQQSQKMEAVGTLAGGIAHDFNNILSIIMGNAQLAFDDVPNGNPARECLDEIHLATIRAKDMVQALLAFSRKSDQESKPLDMVPLAKESMRMLRSAIPTSIEFKQHISDDPCNVMGDAAQINQIVMNLVTNAADAMSEEGGFLEVTVENVVLREEKPCFNWILSPGAYVRLGLRDTGKGIEPKIMGRIFEPYYTSKEIGKGTGMGLSVVHGIVKRNGGGIRVESEPGKGTLFEIYFHALEKVVVEEKELHGKIEGGSDRVLFVDDESSIVRLNHLRLEGLGYHVKSTTKPLEALEWFKADPDQFDVIITDMTMPRMSGDMLTTEILAIRPEMPVIICTGYSERTSAEKAKGLGVCKYLEKPFDFGNMASTLREVLEEK
jgi:PAS domain S-box-containing protein